MSDQEMTKENPCTVCGAHGIRGRVITNASPMTEAGYSVALWRICSRCLEHKEETDAKLAEHVASLKRQAEGVERLREMLRGGG
jgi:hypothetical protein